MRQQLSFSVEIDRIIKVTSQSSTKRFRDKVGAIEDQFSSEPLQEKKSTTTKISILTKVSYFNICFYKERCINNMSPGS